MQNVRLKFITKTYAKIIMHYPVNSVKVFTNANCPLYSLTQAPLNISYR